MTIHIFIAHMGVGGAERVCVNLANEFAKTGHEVHIVVLNLEKDINTHLLLPQIQVHSLKVSRLRYSVYAIYRYIKMYHPPFLLVFGNEMAIILNKLRKAHLIKTPLAVRVLNNVEISLSKEDQISPIVEKYLKKAQRQLKDMDHVIAQCDAMEEMLLAHRLVKKEALTRIYNPVSQDLLKRTKKTRLPIEQRNPDRVKEIVFIGRLDPQKNLTELLEAFAMVYQEDKNIRLHLIGDGLLKDKLQKYVQELGIAEVVFFDGIIKDMVSVYAKADLAALSSEYEGMPNCLIEAVGCGIPVVSYDCPLGPREIIQDGVNGYLTEYRNVKELAQKMKQALDQTWIEADIQKTCDKFRVEKIAEQYLEIFQTLMK